MGSIKEELLLKAQRDVSKLVKVQRMVTRGGKTFAQNFYVQPNQVKSTDKVIGNQQNLLPAMSSVPKPAAGVLDKAYFDMLASSDKTKALEYLKSCNVSWSENSHAGINWMRAMQAFKSALGAQNGTQSSTQPNSQQSNSNPKTAQNNQPTGQAVVNLDSATKTELNACKNGKEKVIVLKKKLGQDGCIKFAESLGVTWNKHDHAAINNMRMSMALQEYFDKLYGTTSPKNDNSKKKTDSKPKDNPDEIKAPANATPRQQNIVNIINSITDTSEIETFTSVGMVPEDDVSKAFILEKLAPKYAVFAAAHLKTTSSGSKSRSNGNYASGFADQIAYDLNYEGCAKKVVGQGLSQLYDMFNMAMITNPRSQIATAQGDFNSRRGKSNSMLGILSDFNEVYSQYTTDEYADASSGVLRGSYMTNMGYTGGDPEVYEKRYDVEKEGFVRAIRSIQKKYPQLKAKGDEMVADYNEIMKICKGNPNLLNCVLYRDNWSDDSTDGKPSTWRFGESIVDKRTAPNDARETIRVIDLQYNALMKLFKDKGMSEEAIKNTLADSYWNDDFNNFQLHDENNKVVETVDVHMVKDENGTLILNDENSKKTSSNFIRYMHAKFASEHGLNVPGYCENALNAYKQYQQIASITEEDYLKIQDKYHKIFGQQYTTTDLNTGKTEVVDLTKLSAKSFDYSLGDCKVTQTHDKDLDYILSNLSMMSMETRIHRSIVREVGRNPSSKLNGGGTDMSKNYSFYIPTNRELNQNTRVKSGAGWGNNSSQFTLDELNAKVNEQLDSLKTYSPEYIEKVAEYYNAKSSYQNATGEATKANMRSVGINVSEYWDNPLKDILYNYTTAIAHNIPKMSERGTDKLDALMAKRMDYVPYDFKAAKQKRLSDTKTTKASSGSQGSELKRLREELFKSVHCTISVEPDDVSLQMRKDFMKNWDYRDNHTETTPDGFTKTEKLYSGSKAFQGKDRRALFNSRFFKVNNSNMEDDYSEYQQQLKADTTLDAKASEELELYHACSYSGVAGILGKTGGWFMGNQYTKVAKALGNGAYFGYKGGKSSVYCGEGSGGYHNIEASGADGDNANGCYILATVMRGKSNDSQSDHGRFRDYEIAVKNNKCIKPHHFVDISARALDINIKRDGQGNYVDIRTGQITHDRYGQSVNMK